MTVQTSQQLQALCQAILLGGCLGAVYDGMRVVRCRLPLRWLEGVLDFLFWVGSTGVLFLWSQSAWGGQIRWYGPLFCMVGGVFYFWGLSPLVLTLGYRLADLAGLVWRMVCWPVRLGRKVFKKFPKPPFLSGKNRV